MSERRGRWTPRGPVLLFREARDAAAGLRLLRAASKLSQPEFAVLLGEKPAWLKAREQGSVRMTRSEAEKIAAGLGTDFEGLLAEGASHNNQTNGAGK